MARNNSELAFILANEDDSSYRMNAEMSATAVAAERGTSRRSSVWFKVSPLSKKNN